MPYVSVYFPQEDKDRHDQRVARGEPLPPFNEYVRASYYARVRADARSQSSRGAATPHTVSPPSQNGTAPGGRL